MVLGKKEKSSPWDDPLRLEGDKATEALHPTAGAFP